MFKRLIVLLIFALSIPCHAASAAIGAPSAAETLFRDWLDAFNSGE